MISYVISPLNSNIIRETAVIVALIMWGVAPANPPAIIVTYSWILAGTATRYYFFMPIQ